MTEEIIDDGTEPTPQQKAMMQAWMHGGMLKFKYTETGQVDVDVIPIHDLYLDTPKDNPQ